MRLFLVATHDEVEDVDVVGIGVVELDGRVTRGCFHIEGGRVQQVGAGGPALGVGRRSRAGAGLSDLRR